MLFRSFRLWILWCAVLVLNLLVLTRASFHILLLPVFLGMGAVLAGDLRRRFLWPALVICMLSVGWYAKNQAMFGFFGASSWMGSNLWRIASANYAPETLDRLQAQGVLDSVAVERKYFDPPSAFRPFGFDRTSKIAVLARDDYNNINMIDIADMHRRNALRLIRYDPRHYLANVAEAYSFYCRPSFQTRPLATNLRRLPTPIFHLSRLDGRDLAKRLNDRVAGSWTSLYQVLIPLVLLGYFGRALWLCRGQRRHWAALVRAFPAETSAWLLIGYLTAVSIFFEHGENCRFKFPVESLIVCMTLAIPFGRLWREPWRPTGAVPPDPKPGDADGEERASEGGGTS